MKKITLLFFFALSIYYCKAQPANDDCTGSIAIPILYGTCTPIAGTLSGATASGLPASCGGTPNDDVFYNFVATSPTQTITATPCSSLDIVVQAYSSTCGGTLIGCVNSLGVGGTETLTLSGLTAGSMYFVRVYDFTGSSSCNTFTICVYAPLNAYTTNTAATCYNSCNGTAVGSVTGGVGPFGYSWTGPSAYTATGTNLTSLCPGTYTLTVTTVPICRLPQPMPQ